MNWKRAVTRTIARGATAFSKGKIRPGFRVLLYHAVGTRLQNDTYGISIQPELFEAQIKVLAEYRERRILDLVDFTAKSPSHDATKPAPLRVAVTFDDGYKDNLSTAAPILTRYGIPFTVFVTSSFIQQPSSEYLTPAELKELASLPGVTIGAHGATHRPLAECDDATLQQELNTSRAYLEDVLGKPVTTLAYPHGSTNLHVRAAAQQVGYTTGGCSRFDINDKERDPLLLCRCEVWADDSIEIFRQKLAGGWDWYHWRGRDPATY